ncbi:MAG TPA: photosynthetic reaction center cytochrome c subunit family protein [Bryobacteraceae bacterium]|nr:photosynthetic reaction center cytochrome c subunit family protein [Bryobacteraceae bacterium]
MITGAVALLGGTMPFGLTSRALAQTPASPRPEMSEKAFKNVQVLKGIPVDEFMGTMGLFSAALSYCCGDCHVGAGTDDPKWEAETPRKIVARKMTEMVNTINKNNFGGSNAVTCWTCHRGSPGPAATPSIDMIYGEPLSFPPDVVPPARSGNAPTVDQIFERYLSALGGADAANKISSYSAKGASHLFGETRDDSVELYAKAPDNLVTTVHQREGDLARSFNGRDAWVMLPLTVVKEYPLAGSAREGGKLDAEMAFPWKLRSYLQNWRVGSPITLNGREVNVLQGSAQGILATFYFDKQTNLLTRMIHYANSAVGRVPTQVDYSDYRDVNGVKMPFKWTYSWVSGREEYALSQVQPNVQIEAAKFGRPVQRTK